MVDAVTVQRKLLALGYPIGNPDGDLGPKSLGAMSTALDELAERRPAGLKPAAAAPRVITEAMVAKATAFLSARAGRSVTPAQVWAVVDVESGGGWFTDVRAEILNLDGPGGFIDSADGSLPKILFEAHLFGRHTKGRFNRSHPALSSPSWNRELYKGGQAEWQRLHAAMALDETAALLSASVGTFQILGQNFRVCGFETVRDFWVAHMRGGAEAHLGAFCAFVTGSGLAPKLARISAAPADCAPFAAAYNGPAYDVHDYDGKIARAFVKRRAG